MHAPASLDVVEDVVRREFDAQERRADAADTRAGLVLGFAGLVVSVGGSGIWLPLALTARFLAGLAGLAALTALAPRSFNVPDLRALPEWLPADATRTRLALLTSDVDAYSTLRARLATKLARLRLASRLLMASLAFATLGAIVEGAT